MPQVIIDAAPSVFTAPENLPFPPIEEPVSFRIPALPLPPNANCFWAAMSFYLECEIYEDWSVSQTTQLAMTFAVFNDTAYHYFFLYDPIISGGHTTLKGVTTSVFLLDNIPPFNTDKYTARDIPMGFSHQGRQIDVTKLQLRISTPTCIPLPDDDPPDGDDDGDDDDDSAGASGQYRAIEADSPRNWLHVGSGASIVTYHTTPQELAFTSGAHAPKWWKQFCYNQRNSGVLACLGRDADPGSSTVFLSYDGGQTTEEAYNVTGTSVIMDYDSEREWLVVLAEGTPEDVEDPTSHGVVARFISRDFGQTFTEEGEVTIDDGPLLARLLGMTYDPRTGGTLYLLCKILGVTKILASEDGGDSWEERFS